VFLDAEERWASSRPPFDFFRIRPFEAVSELALVLISGCGSQRSSLCERQKVLLEVRRSRIGISGPQAMRPVSFGPSSGDLWAFFRSGQKRQWAQPFPAGSPVWQFSQRC